MASPSASTLSLTANPTTPAYTDDLDWMTAYLAIHSMSDPSRRYGYLLWIAVVFIFLLFGILHWTGSRGGFIGATWSKWALRRRTWRKKHSLAIARRNNEPHRQPSSLPSNAQLLCLTVLLLATIALSIAGPDYITPSDKVWEFYKFHRRAISFDSAVSGQPQYTINKAWWTAGGRTGLIAFALLPLCVLFALKAPPFAILAIPFMVQLHFDKLAWLHRWSGRLVWLVSAVHAATWMVQLVTDTRPSTGKIALTYAWNETRFICAWISFGLLTLIIVFSIHPLRRTHYEAFYFLHILLVPLFLITAALHHPPVWYWCWAALGLWIGERLWRATWWLSNNGYFGGMTPSVQIHQQSAPARQHKQVQWVQAQEIDRHPPQSPGPYQLQDSSVYSFNNVPAPRRPTSPLSHHPNLKSPLSPTEDYYSPRAATPASSIYHTSSPSASSHFRTPFEPTNSYLPPTGYAHAELLSGRTVRLRYISPGPFSWAPGQHFLINIPSVSRFTSHPFTAAAVCDEQNGDSGRELVFLIRAKKGWTKELWDSIITLMARHQSHPPGERPTKGTEMPPRGVLMRMYIDGPFGSSVRARWGSHSTVLIVAGGSGRDGKHLGGRPGGWGKKSFSTTRVRFVWLVREFCHIQWGASIIRRCMAMVPAPGLHIDIFVTNFTPMRAPRLKADHSYPPTPTTAMYYDKEQQDLLPPTPGFARGGAQRPHSPHTRDESSESLDDHQDSVEDYVDLSYYTSEQSGHGGYPHEQAGLGLDHEDHILDLTNFDGDNDEALPGEEALNRSVKKQGTIRRAKTRKATRATQASQQRLRERRAAAEARRQTQHGPHPTHVQTLSHESALSTDRLLSYGSPATAGIEHRLSTTEEVDLGNTAMHEASLMSRSPNTATGEAPWHIPRSHTPPMSPDGSGFSRSESYFSNWDSRSDTASFRDMLPRTGVGAAGQEVRLEVDEQSMHDINVVSEHARPGKPKLDRMIADEVENSKGSTIVACCGPTSLNAMVRKIIAAQIDPSRIRRGDMRGMIALVSEEFEY